MMVVLIDPEIGGLNIDGGPDRSGFRFFFAPEAPVGGVGGFSPPTNAGGRGGAQPPHPPGPGRFFPTS